MITSDEDRAAMKEQAKVLLSKLKEVQTHQECLALIEAFGWQTRQEGVEDAYKDSESIFGEPAAQRRTP